MISIPPMRLQCCSTWCVIVNRAKSADEDKQHQLASLLRQLGGCSGFAAGQRRMTFLKSHAGQSNGLSDTAIDEMIAARLQARASKGLGKC